MLDRLASVRAGHERSIETESRSRVLADGMRVRRPRRAAGAVRLGARSRATGSPEHVAQLEARARERGIDLGILAAPEEPRVYRALGLPWIPPEVRDGTDEIAAAAAGDRSPISSPSDDITTAFHCHTTYSDGKDVDRRDGAGRRASSASRRSRSPITRAAASYAGGLDADGLRAQAAEIAGLVDPPARVLRGTEADILEDGAIDVPAELRARARPRDRERPPAVQARRGRDDRARSSPRCASRSSRSGATRSAGSCCAAIRSSLRIDDVLDAIAESRAAIEINGDPHRLDLDPDNARKALARGIKFVLSSDAHSTRNLGYLKWAVRWRAARGSASATS